MTANIAGHLPAAAAREPNRPAVIVAHGRARPHLLTFRQLDQESDRLAHGLGEVGIGRGTRTVLMVKPSPEFFALTFALFKSGAVPVMVDPGMGVRNLGQCLREAEPAAFIGIPKAHLARRLFGWARGTLKTCVTVGGSGYWGGHTLNHLRRVGRDAPFPITRPGPDETAAILFTSGSTGVPKGVVYTHDIFAAQVELLRGTYGIEPGEVDLATFPLFALFAPALGMTSVIPRMDATRPGSVDPPNIIGPINEFAVTNLFGSPALLHRVGLYGEAHQVRLPSLRRVLSAGAPVPAHVLARWVPMLPPQAQVFTPYGATEALPVTSISAGEVLGETAELTRQGRGVCVGRPVAGVDVAVIPITDDPVPTWSADLPLPDGVVGEIVVRGPAVTREYYNRPRSTELAKIRDPNGGPLRHRMGDLGYTDACGRLWVCGRKSHRVVTRDGTMFTLTCEGVFNAHPAVHRTALVGVGPPSEAQPVLCVELKPECRKLDRAVIRAELLALGGQHRHTARIGTILFHPSFPVDIRHNAKIFREKLAAWAAGKVT